MRDRERREEKRGKKNMMRRNAKHMVNVEKQTNRFEPVMIELFM